MEVYGFDREGLDAFYRTQRGLEERGETVDRSTRIEDEQIGPAGAESQAAQAEPAPEAAPERATEAEEAPAEPEPVAAAEEVEEPAEEARENESSGRRQAVEAWNERIRLGPSFGPGEGFPWAEVLTGVSGAALLLSLAALFVVLGRGGAAPAPAVPPPALPPMPAGDGSNWGGWRRRDDDSPPEDDPAPDDPAPDASAPDKPADD